MFCSRSYATDIAYYAHCGDIATIRKCEMTEGHNCEACLVQEKGPLQKRVSGQDIPALRCSFCIAVLRGHCLEGSCIVSTLFPGQSLVGTHLRLIESMRYACTSNICIKCS